MARSWRILSGIHGSIACRIPVILCLLLLAGCGMGSRRIQPIDFPFDSRLDCVFDDRHVILFLIDGCPAYLLEEMIGAGELPNIEKYIHGRGAAAMCAMAPVPSVTNAAVAAVTCGSYPGHINIIGNRWFDHEMLERLNVISLYDYYLTNERLSGNTIYEMLYDEPTVAIATRCSKGSTYTIPFYYNLIAMKYFLLGNWMRVDEVFIRQFMDVADCANREGVFPRFTFFHLPGLDPVAHKFGIRSREARSMVKNIDRSLGMLFRLLRKNGVFERICIVITADHGHVELGGRNYVLWERYLRERLRLPALEMYRGFDRVGDALRRESHYGRFCVIVSNNGRNAILHIRHNPRGEWVPPGMMASWEARPSWNELRNYATPQGMVDIIEELRRTKGVAFVIGRPEDGKVAIFSASGEGLIRTAEGNDETGFAYEVVSGDDPLGYLADPGAAALMDGRFHSSREWLKVTCGLGQADVVAQLPSLFESACCGDIFLVAGDGWNFEKGYAGGHGGFLREEMRVPILIAGPGIGRKAFGPVRSIDIVPTVLEYLGHGERIKEFDMDGVSFWNEIRE